MITEKELKEEFSKLHSGDQQHLDVIFSKKNRLIVEAPAGSGKTKLLISKIAHTLATKNLPINKKILILTFSINAAYKIKKVVAEILPELLNDFSINPNQVSNIVTVTNFHGFARKVLRKYGYLLSEKLRYIDFMEDVPDNYPVESFINMNIGLSEEEAHWITDFYKNITLNTINFKKNYKHILKYLNLVDTYFLPNNKIPFNAYLLYLLQLFKEFPKLKRFYNLLYPIVIADEFQDTNSLMWDILQTLIVPETKCWLFGDSLQRIYGFIGAVENIINIAKEQYNMEVIKLSKNYRFKDNEGLLLIDKNIRVCSQDRINSNIKQAKVPIYYFQNITDENRWFVDFLQKFLKKSINERLVILTPQRNKEISQLLDNLNSKKIPFFNALFTDDVREVVIFHEIALKIFNEFIKRHKFFVKSKIKNYIQEVTIAINKEKKIKEFKQSLLKLLEIFLNHFLTEYRFLDPNEKILYIKDTLANRGLRHSMEFIDDKIIISTIHAAKGLEWDTVIIKGLKGCSLPSWKLCEKCFKYRLEKNQCELDIEHLLQESEVKKIYLEELSVFYVAATRAKKELYITTNQERIKNDGITVCSQLSCLLKLPGISANIINIPNNK